MNRRTFLGGLPGLASLTLLPNGAPKTEHLVFIVNGGGVRKKDYYENGSLSPNICRLAREACVFEQDHCEQVASHDEAFAELVGGLEFRAIASTTEIPKTLRRSRPRVIVFRETGHDVGHSSYDQYLAAVRATDDAVGRLFDWVRTDPDFAGKTAIVIRPEFGRDDEINQHGQIHHSYGFYYTHRVASIFWGPDFKHGVDRTTVIRAKDMAPNLKRLLPGVFKT